ncbi:MAG: YeeE/YedE family protein [Pseudomonadota bacterium]
MSLLTVSGAIVLGLLFGFALQRGSFCGSSLLSSVILFKDSRGLVAILVAVLVSMAGFAFLAHMGWVVPNPNPMRLLSAVVGGLVFGTGMVLAGGCISGTLYKAGEGRLTSMLALAAVGVGSSMVDGGVLAPVKKALVRATGDIQWSAGLDEAFGLSYATLAAVLGAAGLLAVLAVCFARRRPDRPKVPLDGRKLVSGGWSPITAGVAVGILGWFAYLLSSAAGRNYPLGAHGGVKGAFSLLVGGKFSGSVWMILMVGGIIVGSAISARMRGDLKLRSADAGTLLFALLGGVLLGIGTALGRGCFIGNTVSGLALLSLHSAIFTVCMIAANFATTILYLRGVK